MSSYEDRMAEKYNFLKKENTDHKSEDNVSEEKPVENQQKNVEIPEEGSLLVPLDAWNTVLNQLGNLHEASQQMAEARERAAKAESEASFSNSGLYLEKFIVKPRHIEIQVMGDQYGNVSHLSERDCSIQRRHQKLIEETPSPFVDDELRNRMGEAAVKACKFIKYEGAGTIEFLVDANKDFYFMEMNTRIQVEHGITEEVTDYDLIKEQIKVADGAKVSGKHYYPKLHSIECRINAEDPKANFRPCPGNITALHKPGGHGVRVDSHIYSGYVIPPNYDSMIAKLMVSHQSREEAIVRMKRALNEFIIEGIETTIPFHIKIMDDENFKKGDFTTNFMDTFEY